MKTNTKVTQSSQLEVALPQFIQNNYSTFVNFMQKSAESEERIGFGQDILQNLQKYRNFDTYKDQIVRFGTLKGDINETVTELTLENSFGFPEENGVLLIGDEVILYRTKEGNTLYDLQRGASGTTVLPTLRSPGTYLNTKAQSHQNGAQVTNLSVLFLVSMLETIHESFAVNLDSSKIAEGVNHGVLLQNIKDFFASKGSKLGIRAFFKMMFGETDVNVVYPGDKMIKPSVSNWKETPILRTEPFPEILSDPSKTYTTPDKLIGADIVVKDYNTGEILGSTVCDYVSSYPYEDVVQYEMYLNKDRISGNFPINPSTTLTRELRTTGDNNDLVDTFTVTVESTVGFPDSGVLFVDNEGIFYTGRTLNQFLNCTRGYVSVETYHSKGSHVYGPYYIQGEVVINGETRTSYSWPLSLVSGITIEDPGSLFFVNNPVYINGPGKEDPSEEILDSLRENSGDSLMTQTNTMPNMANNTNFTYGITGVAFNDDYVFVESSNFPEYQIGAFSTDNSVGPEMQGVDDIHLIPRRNKIASNPDNILKGTGKIGVAVDGVPFYSNEAPGRLISGQINKIEVTEGGGGYLNPTVVIEPGSATATATVVNGKITEITVDNNDDFTSQPSVRITSGEGFESNLTFDNYGRLTGVAITSGGQYFTDRPALSLVDSSGRGKGSLVSCTVNGGLINSVTILASGIDYNPSTTTLQVVPIGSNATAVADCQGYTFDRPGQVNNNANWTFDSGNGFLYEDKDNVRSRFGYVGSPDELRATLGDTGTGHSPLLGWAYDGNPIYGPYAYANGVDDSEGIVKQFTAYVLQDDRTTVIPHGSTVPATLPPSTTLYPMGTFVEDYVYDPVGAAIRGGRLMTELDELLQAEPGDEYINYQTFIPGVLSVANGKVCNTPEFPPELYPNGVFCYFVATFGDEMQFPYIMGPSFHDRPVSQNVAIKDGEKKIRPTDIGETYDTTLVEFEYDTIFRLRNNSLEETKDELDININGVTSGSIDGIIVEDGHPDNSAVGDSLTFEDYNIDGTGASAKVSHIVGEVVTETAGYDITTQVLSHRQRIVIPLDDVDDYTFFNGFQTRTLNGVSISVIGYDYSTGFLDIAATNDKLVQFGDVITDVNGKDFTIPTSQLGSNYTLNQSVVGGDSLFMSYSQPTSSEASAGDLWWSSSNGRLYIYYTDADTTPGSSNWVTAQPVGMRPFVGAGDIGIGTTASATPGFATPQSDNFVSISTTAPGSRSDGTANQPGDFWWSSHTGMLYIWVTDGNLETSDGTNEYTAQWVATDPTAVVNRTGVSNSYEYSAITTTTPPDYSQSVRVLISEASPTQMDDGGPLTPGVLWWSPLNGKMYIYYTDSDSTSQWVICNPNATLSGKYGLSTIPSGDGGEIPDFISILPEPADQEVFWLEDTAHFAVGDSIKFIVGAPGVTELTEVAEIVSINSPQSIRVIRTAETNLEIPNGTEVLNLSKSLYFVTTQEPHSLRKGDEVTITSTQEGLNGTFVIQDGGFIESAAGTVTIAGGAVTGVTITDPGRFYQSDFYVQFVGGGGTGAYGIARVSDLVDGGEVGSVDIIEGGVNYSTAPSVVWPYGNTTYQFYIYTKTTCAAEDTITYDTSSLNAVGVVSRVQLFSGGLEYIDIPKVLGLQKRSGDKALAFPVLAGTTIEEIQVQASGFRYSNPTVLIIDAEESGTGATATATLDGESITSVTVTNPGTGYKDPRVFFVEEEGKYICTTKDIGRLTSYEIINPGRNISADKALNPEIKPQTRVVLQQIDGSTMNWVAGSEVYQGTVDYKLNTATVVSYDSDRQILTVEKINGEFRTNENLYSSSGAGAKIVVNGQSDSYVNISSIATPVGKFVSDTTKLSSKNGAIQDSKYYQWFSYEIASPLQQVEYETFVKEVIHPAGFELFSKLGINSGTDSSCSVSDITLTSTNHIILTTETPVVLRTEDNLIIAGEQSAEE